MTEEKLKIARKILNEIDYLKNIIKAFKCAETSYITTKCSYGSEHTTEIIPINKCDELYKLILSQLEKEYGELFKSFEEL